MDNDDVKKDPFAEGFGIEEEDADKAVPVEEDEAEEEGDESVDDLAEKELEDDSVEEDA